MEKLAERRVTGFLAKVNSQTLDTQKPWKVSVLWETMTVLVDEKARAPRSCFLGMGYDFGKGRRHTGKDIIRDLESVLGDKSVLSTYSSKQCHLYGRQSNHSLVEWESKIIMQHVVSRAEFKWWLSF